MPLRRLSYVKHALGAMNKVITLYAPKNRPADGGMAPPDVWGTRWGDVRALGGRELEKAQQIAQEIDHTVTIMYETGISQSFQVGFENRMFQIKYIEEEDERHVFLDLYCAEIGQNAGSQK